MSKTLSSNCSGLSKKDDLSWSRVSIARCSNILSLNEFPKSRMNHLPSRSPPAREMKTRARGTSEVDRLCSRRRRPSGPRATGASVSLSGAPFCLNALTPTRRFSGERAGGAAITNDRAPFLNCEQGSLLLSRSSSTGDMRTNSEKRRLFSSSNPVGMLRAAARSPKPS